MAQVSLLRNLRTVEALGIVIGSMIGTGVFLKTSTMTQLVGSPAMVLLAWAVAGFLSLMGALVYAELGAMYPDSGGEYVYLREAYGDCVGFLLGWMRFWIATPAANAAFAVGAMTFFEGLIPLGENRVWYAAFTIALLSGINCLPIAFGGAFQAVLTGLKLILIGGLTLALFCFGAGHSLSGESAVSGSGFGSFGLAVLSALWAFDGWCNLSSTAGEVREPERVLPRALMVGTFTVFLVYALTNLSYFFALPISEVLNASSTSHPNALPVATKAAAVTFGENATVWLSFMFVLSALGAMNGSILTGARVPYAMARDGLFFRPLAHVFESTRVPGVSVLSQGLISCVLVFWGSFDQLTDYVVFASWIFYGLVGGAVLVLRTKKPTLARPFRTPLYPWLPIAFVVSTAILLINTLWTAPRESSIGLAFIVSGIPVYLWFRRKNN